MDSLLRTEVETPIKAESSREANRWSEMSVFSLDNWRIPAGNCKILVRSSARIGDELSTELTRLLVEASSRGFLLPTIATEAKAQAKPYLPQFFIRLYIDMVQH